MIAVLLSFSFRSISSEMIVSRKASFFLQRCYSVQVPVPVSVIKVPKYVEKHVDKQKMKEYMRELNFKKQRKIAYRGDTSIPVISSTHGDFNFYLGQIYNERYKLPLQSEFWFKTKSAGQKFTINPTEPNPSLPSNDPHEYVDDALFPNDFAKMNLNPDVLNCLLNDFNFEKPLRAQSLVIPRVLSGEHVLLCTETGAGKTISYLAPFIHHISSLKKTEKVYPDTPLGIVVTPGRELAEQIGDIAYKLGQSCNVNVKVLISEGTRLEYLKLYPDTQVDFLVASVGSLVKLLSKSKIKVANVRHIALDEADTLLDDSFIEDIKYLFQRLPIRTDQEQTSFGAQLVLASSIYPTNLHEIYCDEFTETNFTKICSPYLHRVPAHIKQKFIRVNNDNRAGEALELIKKDYEKNKQVLVFCNKSETCDWLSIFLKDNGVPNEIFHGGIVGRKRSGTIRRFKKSSVLVLCCTDLASRGIDTQTVKHVINFDFPNNVSDYLLRVGRVGRAGSNQGHVTNLVVHKPGVHTVNEIETSVKKCRRIPNIDSNIAKKIRKLYFTF